MLSIQALLVGWIGCRACPNKTEVGHMAAAVYFWHTARFDVFDVNPPLTRIITAMPVAMCSPTYDWDFYSSRPQDRSEWRMGRAFIDANSREKIRWCFTRARWSLVPLLLLGGYFGYRLSREIYGECAGFVFLAVWSSSPLLLAWGATVCPDAVAAALGLVALYAFRQWLYKPNWTRAALAGVCLGFLPLTKLTWIIAFAVWPLMWCFWTLPALRKHPDRRYLPLPPLRQLATILFLGLYALNMGYLFDGTFRPLSRYEFISQLFRGDRVPENQETPITGNRFTGTWLGDIPVPLPADFVQGIDTQRSDFERGAPSYLRGEWADHGWWYYYLYALAIKEPLGTWCLVGLALGLTVYDWRPKKRLPANPLAQAGEGKSFSASWRDELLVLAPLAAILAFVSSQTGFSAHPRYVIPALPFVFVWASKAGRAFETRPFAGWRLALIPVVVLALAWSVGSSLAIYPHSLSYFNELAALLTTPADASYPKSVILRAAGNAPFVVPPLGGSSPGFRLKPVLRTSANPSRARYSRADTDHGILSRIQCLLTAGPRNGPRHLLDSSIDWGQDLFYLEDWLESHPEARPIKVAYFGGYPLDRSNVKSSGSPPVGAPSEEIDDRSDAATFGPLPGWYALSVNEIYARSQQYRYFLHFRPVATAGYSIYIYQITVEDANRVRRETGLPELVGCDELGESHHLMPRPQSWCDSQDSSHPTAVG
ncbi:MAG: hypothetical protein ACLQNE_01595 [Thermoguttaceae bacterium]